MLNFRAVLNDVDALNAIVDGAAEMLGSLLSLKDPLVKKGCKHLGQLLYEGKSLMPSRDALDEVHQIALLCAFSLEASTQAESLLKETKLGENVVLSNYATKHCYVFSQSFSRKRGDRVSKMQSGGLGEMLYNELQPRIASWMLKCDQTMNEAFNDHGGDSEFDESYKLGLPQRIGEVIRQLSHETALRLIVLQDETNPFGFQSSNKVLCARMLEQIAESELHRTRDESERLARLDLIALRSFEFVARRGLRGDEGLALLEKMQYHLNHVAQRPANELGLRGANAGRINMQGFKRAVDLSIDIEVRRDLINDWQAAHGACAAVAAMEGIRQLENLHEGKQKSFVPVLQTTQMECDDELVSMPEMTFVQHDELKFVSAWRMAQRTGLDWVGRRVVRLSSLFMQLLGLGRLERGVVSSELVAPIAARSMRESHAVYEMISRQRKNDLPGMMLLQSLQEVADAESHLADQVSHALCHVSKFSMHDLLSVLHHDSPILSLIRHELTLRTRAFLIFDVPSSYIDAAVDTLPIILPVLKHKRESVGITFDRPGNPVADILRTIRRVRFWTPLQGSLSLSRKDIKGASPLALPMLKEFAEKNSKLVTHKRLYVNGKKEAEQKFHFNTPALVDALRNF
jgi:hypothetical protein